MTIILNDFIEEIMINIVCNRGKLHGPTRPISSYSIQLILIMYSDQPIACGLDDVLCSNSMDHVVSCHNATLFHIGIIASILNCSFHTYSTSLFYTLYLIVHAYEGCND